MHKVFRVCNNLTNPKRERERERERTHARRTLYTKANTENHHHRVVVVVVVVASCRRTKYMRRRVRASLQRGVVIVILRHRDIIIIIVDVGLMTMRKEGCLCRDASFTTTTLTNGGERRGRFPPRRPLRFLTSNTRGASSWRTRDARWTRSSLSTTHQHHPSTPHWGRA